MCLLNTDGEAYYRKLKSFAKFHSGGNKWKELKHKRAAAKRRHEASAITRQSVKEHFDSLGRVLVNMQPPVAQMIDGEIEMLPGPCCKCMKQETTAYRRKHMCERKDNTISCVWQSF